MELICPAGNLPALKAAVDNGAGAVYTGFRDHTNARHFAGLNFTHETLREGIEYAHKRDCKVFLALNTYPQPEGWQRWRTAADKAAEQGVDALIVADIGLLTYITERWPDVRRHLSVQASATNLEAIRFYHQQFDIRRVVLPRVLSLRQVENLATNSPVALEVFGFGSLCVMAEGRCLLSSYVTGRSPNTYGACSPASHVEWRESDSGLESRLGDVLIDSFSPEEVAGYPTLCKGRFQVEGKNEDKNYYAIEEPVSLNTIDLLPNLMDAGVAAIKIEGRQRSPAYVAQVTRTWREAIDACLRDPKRFSIQQKWSDELSKVAEGSQTTFGAYHRPWQ